MAVPERALPSLRLSFDLTRLKFVPLVITGFAFLI